MNRHVNAIASRLSLRFPQRESLEILDRVCEILPPKKDTDWEAGLAAIREEFPTVTAFERDFPSLCFALATGVGKTRLMGAFITYLYSAHDIKNFFVLAPNLTIYNKLITDFTPNTPKYVFKGISEFATNTPKIITGDNYEMKARTLLDPLIPCKINIFNISKINSEVRGGKSPRIKRLSEYIGDSYFNFLAELKDLVILMDESHRYRASAGVRAINELKPLLGLELTATPFVETSKGAVQFQNVVYDYPLGRAIEDGFVKEPAVVTRKDFNPVGMSAEAIEHLKLEDGIRLHENIKAELETYARETGNPIVKPFLLVIARDTTHATQLLNLIQSESFFEGRYKDKIIQVDSSKKGAKEDEMVERLLKVEHRDEPTEIVVHVNMLKEGWDVTNLYTIVPLRAANARILIEQSIGRGLRLPYGKRTGVTAVDRLNIIAHDKFQEIIDEAQRPESPIRLQQVILPSETLQQKTVTLVSQSQLETQLGFQPSQSSSITHLETENIEPIFESPEEQKIAQMTYQAIRKLESQPAVVPTNSYLLSPEVQKKVKEAVASEYQPEQLELEGILEPPNVNSIVTQTLEMVVQKTINIPRILVVPKGEVRSGFRAFTLQLDSLKYSAPSRELWIQHLKTNQYETVELGQVDIGEKKLENYVVNGLIDFDDIYYDEHADFLYDLAEQVVSHFRTYLSEEDTGKVLQVYGGEIASFVHAQMMDNFWEKPENDYEVIVSRGFTTLKSSAYSVQENDPPRNYQQSPDDKSNMAKYLFGGFSRCLYPVQKFQSDSERILSIILDREAIKWFKPAKGQFQIYYSLNGEHLEYQPDFVAETEDIIYMLECKMKSQINAPEVIVKKQAAVKWCKHASEYMQKYGDKPWVYVLIPHNFIAQNITLKKLTKQFYCD
ncbi:DEAD/DEAH box helicase family protein [Lyngbya sp. CCY1209]|uniref:DEAD/DEAH box helicase family protein n=1 Tax=Lyngbya sp. CCY1209 TaxID=2886103 RepID=UPI002D2179B7|nr:DEAD/DEAH box helicase family protein [Lyngbya sp. CCY1209]MEB3884993.1 DEAD/DEAH box helicase family protein [Lyngbya sp. CCY1209]